MKKSILIPALAAFALLSFTSCEKEKHEETVLEQSMDKVLKVNESATFTLPATTDDEYKITTVASHAYVSKLSEDIEGNSIYVYTPEKDYAGTDLVVVSSVEEKHPKKNGSHHGGASKGGGHCNGNKNSEQQVVVTINLTMVKDNSTVSTATKAAETK